MAQARVGRAEFVASPILMPDGTAGFEEEAGSMGIRLMVVAPDGTASYSESGTGRSLTGRCERTE